jgi:hypothetical protein
LDFHTHNLRGSLYDFTFIISIYLLVIIYLREDNACLDSVLRKHWEPPAKENRMTHRKLRYATVGIALMLGLLAGCTQETQNQIGRSVQNWTGTNGVLDIYAGDKLTMRFIGIDKLSTAYGTHEDAIRPYRFGYGTVDKNLNHKLISYGKVVRPGLGVTLVEDQSAQRFGIDGVLILDVVPRSVAARAGLRPTRQDPAGRVLHGDVITAINDTSIHNGNDLFAALDQYHVGDTITLTIQREGQRQRLSITLQALS